MRLVYHPLASDEIIEAARFYEGRSEGLGGDFLDEVDSVGERLMCAPLRWPRVEGEIRRIMMKRFPFGIYYRVTGETVRVLTVKHHRRHPGYGTRRV